MKTQELSPEQIRNECRETLQQHLSDNENIIMCGKRFENNNCYYFLFTEYRGLWLAVRKGLTQFLYLGDPTVMSIPLQEVTSIRERYLGWHIFELIGKSDDTKVGFSFDKKDDFYLRFTKRLREQIDIAKRSNP